MVTLRLLELGALTPREAVFGYVTLTTPWPFLLDVTPDSLIVKSACCGETWDPEYQGERLCCAACQTPVEVHMSTSWVMGESRQREGLETWVQPFTNSLEAVLLAATADEEIASVRAEQRW